jgi:hypothetical protein
MTGFLEAAFCPYASRRCLGAPVLQIRRWLALI